jgi:hypothetical protein|tara:strand:- start:234 stop:482 length:249 start_codon:yes stop_codon:yes gene_type:complete
MSKKKITAKRMQDAFNLNEAHLDALVAAVGVEAALKGALLSTLFAIYNGAPNKKEAENTIKVATELAVKELCDDCASEATVH